MNKDLKVYKGAQAGLAKRIDELKKEIALLPAVEATNIPSLVSRSQTIQTEARARPTSTHPENKPEQEDKEKPTFAPEQTLLIFDWDDTLFPTSWLISEGLHKNFPGAPTSWLISEGLHKNFPNYLAPLASSAAGTLTVAKALGKVVIVTNAAEGWAQWTQRKFMPSLSELLADVKIVAARPKRWFWQAEKPVIQWKIDTFDSLIEGFRQTGQLANVVSVGDSELEQLALVNCRLQDSTSASRWKSFKLLEGPTPSELFKEHKNLRDALPAIVALDEHWEAMQIKFVSS